MVGPGHGHNIEPWLDFFQKRQGRYRLSFLSSDFRFDKERFSNIDIIDTTSVRIKDLSFLKFRRNIYDILYIHGAYSWKTALRYCLFINYKKCVLNFWGEAVIRNAKKAERIRDRIGYRLLLSMVDYFFCNWHGTYDLFTRYFPKLKKKTHITPWGLQKDWFIKNRPEPCQFVRQFLSSINDDDTFVFWPKSILKPVRYDLLIQAVAILKSSEIKDKIQNLKIVIWIGNAKEDELLNYYREMIDNLGVKENICFVDHPYVPFSDIYYLWQRSDFAINFVDNDQLSTTVVEPMLCGKDILLSDITAYQCLNKLWDLKIKLVENTPEAIAEGLKKMILNLGKEDKDFLNSRREIVEREFQFDKNIEKIMEFLKDKIKKGK
jgi:glycosyltransferase involved in cell wall biosynthesis